MIDRFVENEYIKWLGEGDSDRQLVETYSQFSINPAIVVWMFVIVGLVWFICNLERK